MPDRQPARAGGDRMPLSPIGSRRVEAMLALMVSGFGVLFGLQSVPALLDGWSAMATSTGLLLVVLIYGTILLGGLAAALRQWERPVYLLVGVAFVVALIVWPSALVRPGMTATEPWLAAVAGVPCAFVVIAFRSWAPPLIYVVGIASLIAFGHGRGLRGEALLDGVHTLVLALTVLVIVNAARMAARSIDDAQGAALGRYADAQIDEATESERVRTDALVHDSVLTTFLSAAGAVNPEGRLLAARMARNAMNVLSRATVASHIGPKVPVAELTDRIRRDAGGIGGRFDYSVQGVRDHFLPDPVADAVVSAAVQAMTNSVKHAGDETVPRSLVVQGTSGGGVRVTVSDRGRGFDPSAVASERLGLRVSIIERMRRVGGEVVVTTAPGEGATFVLSWPASDGDTAAPVHAGQAVPA